MSQIQGQDYESFENKYYAYKKLLYGIAYAYMNNIYDTEDILQKVFLKLYQCKINFETLEDEKRWLIRVTINLCIDEKKSFWIKNRCSLDNVEEQSYSEKEKDVLQEIRRLPDKYKSCIHLHYIEGYSVSEIAKILGINNSAVKMRLKRGREKLKLELEEQ